MIYVMSDIHGHMKRFRSVMDQIELKADDHLYVLGDCIDRFPDGLEILEELDAMPNVTLLLGNHEHMMLEALTKKHPDNVYFRVWYRNGGGITHERLERHTMTYRKRILEIICQMPVNIEVKCNDKEYLLVHGGPIGYKPKYEDPVMDSVWKRLKRSDVMPSGKVVIFGHTPTDHYQIGRPYRIYHGLDMIGIDCGCAYRDGRLACLRLDDMKEYYSQSDYTSLEDEIREALRDEKNSKG